MFTGIIEQMGTVTALERRGNALRLTVDGGDYVGDAAVGESIAVSGVCLTMTAREDSKFCADVVEETLRKTTLGALRVGDRVNLERPLRADARLGGHIVQGHVDGVGEVVRLAPEADSVMVTFAVPRELARYLVAKGSVAVDGVSLTVVDRTDESFRVTLIPHTRAVTTLGALQVGTRVNIEVDILAKYVEQLVKPYE
ncbi:MAG: riboflavin synthase [Abditibacteriales bacterium]|nr:riboflavin synthase [Abditibacteriales bacterium]MDW8365388.1 riboflavin synthase [Abditibacteriales bacterium]